MKDDVINPRSLANRFVREHDSRGEASECMF